MDGTRDGSRGDPTEVGVDGAPIEQVLLERARAGDETAVEELYARHRDPARRLATILVGVGDADELVAEGFARVLGQLRAGGGPAASFRAYLNTTIRNLHRDQLRRPRDLPASDRPWLLDDSENPIDELVEELDANGATAALSSLPGSWQQVLWHLEVEGRKPAEVAVLLQTNAAAISSLAYRAREGLRRAYLDQYAGPVPIDRHCRWARSRLSQHVRGDLSPRTAAKLTAHLDTCADCAATHAGMAELNTKLAAVLFPVVLLGGLAALEHGAAVGSVSSSPLVAELAARAAGTPVTEAAPAATAVAGPGRLSARSATTVGVAAVAVVALTATALALTRDDSEPRTSPGPAPTLAPTTGVTPPSSPASPSATSAATPPPSTTAPSAPPPPATSPAAVVPTTPAATTPVFPLLPPLPLPTEPVEPPPSLPDSEPVMVRPIAPTATRINGCGTYGSLRLPSTTGIRYVLRDGDGREGRWVVDARAVPGFVIARGAPTRFAGDLGRFEECPVPLSIREVTTTRSGGDAWQVKVTPRKPDGERRSLAVSYWFDAGVHVKRAIGEGWACHGPGGADVVGRRFAAGTKLTCTYGARAGQPPPVALVVDGFDGSGSPSGQVALTADGDVIDTEDFDSVDR